MRNRYMAADAANWVRTFDELFAKPFTNTNYPPHNIIKIDDNIVMVEMAVAGFKKDDIEVTVEGRTLKVTGTASSPFNNLPESVEYITRGLASRSFTFMRKLNDEVHVDAWHKDGILTIRLERLEPRENGVKKIDIRSD